MHITSLGYRLFGLLSILVFILFVHSDKLFNPTLYKAPIEECVEEKRVAFVKVHKAASTTITSILQRFGYTRNLTFALPRKNAYHIGFLETFHPDNVMSIPNGSVYEIICQHVVFNKEAFKRYLPPGIRIIAAVREPTDRFLSSFLYFAQYAQRIKALSKSARHDPISLMRKYLKDPQRYEPEPFKNGSLLLNRMSFDFGLPKEQYFNNSFVMEYIKMIDDSMTLVLVADRFDESLVILKRKMCWSTKDILYKVRHKGHTAKPKLPDELTETLKKMCPSDYKIYEYFSQKLNKTAIAESMLQDEVAEFQKTLRNVSSFCDALHSGIKQESIIQFNATAFSEGFAFDKTDCMSLTLIETEFVKKLVRIQVPKEKYSEFHGWNN